METELAKQRLIDFLFIMEVERWGGSRCGGTWGMGSWFLKGGRMTVSGASSNANTVHPALSWLWTCASFFL